MAFDTRHETNNITALKGKMANSSPSKQEVVFRLGNTSQATENARAACSTVELNDTLKGSNSTSPQSTILVMRPDIRGRKRTSSGTIKDNTSKHSFASCASAKGNDYADIFGNVRSTREEASRQDEWSSVKNNWFVSKPVMPREVQCTTPQEDADTRTTAMTEGESTMKHKRQISLLEWRDALIFECDGYIR